MSPTNAEHTHAQINAHGTFNKIPTFQAMKQISRNLKEIKLYNISSVVMTESATEKYLVNLEASAN